MTDEHLMRHWTDAHSEFSHALDRGVARLGRFFTTLNPSRRVIDTPYVSGACTATRTGDETSRPAGAALAGILACLATTGVLLTLSLLFTPHLAAHAAAGAPIVTHAIVA